mmetsp:Transcript_12504/g.38180  ORF Transcript_12504/g.38180 Transcript_12504/m.38180 type:complete len:341 (-) Transcript_12504:492-1514(-)|eukprot:CAMPEP_0198724608 /NCGR_PEP_ID=MMETSP1475-20131203/2065_1 /TAXON_ID= ORGANISM="Unidentified sp., Strain CCMP1999" /NCGR_SAMPLE_ID=MMETSP1475 /ASSEMBLY_ACC=CAM_ASM_001111 /LENGTH=340 /DNA_ID=CAMNT_0044486185 /DNA_START=119 /DNA_END=1141 /DNA_ORIENTATION=-
MAPKARQTAFLTAVFAHRAARQTRTAPLHLQLNEVTLAHYEAAALVKLRKSSKEFGDEQARVIPGPFSVDLGTQSLPAVTVSRSGVCFDDGDSEDAGDADVSGLWLTWKDLEGMNKKNRTGAYECDRDGCAKIAEFSDETQRSLSLLPLRDGVPPTVIVGGFGMHRLKSSDPGEDTNLKMQALGKVRGHALDICTGLGYTAVALAGINAVDSVLTIELDPSMINIQRRNPWSSELFTNAKIERVVGDATMVLPTIEASSFDVIVHDPPAQAMSGELYSTEFYKELSRVLRRGGKLYHYIGDPESKEAGRLFKGVVNRMRSVGFDVTVAKRAFGIVAKPSA